MLMLFTYNHLILLDFLKFLIYSRRPKWQLLKSVHSRLGNYSCIVLIGYMHLAICGNDDKKVIYVSRASAETTLNRDIAETS